MRKLILIVTAATAVGFTIPVITSAQAEEGWVVIKSGDRGEHRGWNRGHRKRGHQARARSRLSSRLAQPSR